MILYAVTGEFSSDRELTKEERRSLEMAIDNIILDQGDHLDVITVTITGNNQ